jgi:hypothetical protein
MAVSRTGTIVLQVRPQQPQARLQQALCDSTYQHTCDDPEHCAHGCTLR